MEKAVLKRDQSMWQLFVFGMLCMFPWATTQVWALAHITSLGMSTLIYVIGASAMFFTALSYKSMADEFPVAGSAYTYVRQAMHPYVGFMVGWAILMDYLSVPGLLIKFSTSWLDQVLPGVPPLVVILVFTSIITFVVYRKGQIAKWVMNSFLVGQIATIVAFWVLCVIFAVKNGVPFTFDSFYNAQTFSWHDVAKATTFGLLGFIGFDSISTQSEEATNAKKAVGTSVVMSLLVIATIFVTTSYMAATIHPGYDGLSPDTGLFDIIRTVGGDAYGYLVILLCVIFVGIANNLPVVTAVTRMLYVMGRDNTLPFSPFFSKISEKHNTPTNATLFVGILTVLIAYFMSIEFMSRLVNFGAMEAYFVMNVAVIYHFLYTKKLRGFKSVLKYGVCPSIGGLIILYIFTGFDVMTYITGGSWMLVGLIILYTKREKIRTGTQNIEQ